jgi:hypothetical protein
MTPALPCSLPMKLAKSPPRLFPRASFPCLVLLLPLTQPLPPQQCPLFVYLRTRSLTKKMASPPSCQWWIPLRRLLTPYLQSRFIIPTGISLMEVLQFSYVHRFCVSYSNSRTSHRWKAHCLKYIDSSSNVIQKASVRSSKVCHLPATAQHQWSSLRRALSRLSWKLFCVFTMTGMIIPLLSH